MATPAGVLRENKRIEIDLVSRMKRVVESGLALLAKIKENQKKSKRKGQQGPLNAPLNPAALTYPAPSTSPPDAGQQAVEKRYRVID